MENEQVLGVPAAEQALQATVDKYLDSTKKSSGRWSNWAGDLGLDCDTYHPAVRIHQDIRPLPTLYKLKLFRTGQVIETPNIQLLQKAGLTVVEQARYFSWKEKEISGKVDAKIQLDHVRDHALLVPFEHKACSGNVFRAIRKHKLEGIPLTRSKLTWLRKYPGQLSTYCLMDGSEFGVWMFYNKEDGDYFFWVLPLDLEYAETLVQRAERANENVRLKVIPEPVRKPECMRCDIRDTFCFVGKDFGPGARIDLTEELLADVDRLLLLEAAAEEHEDLRTYLAEFFKGQSVITERAWIESKPYETTIYKVPKEVKLPYAEKATYYRFSVKPLLKPGD